MSPLSPADVVQLRMEQEATREQDAERQRVRTVAEKWLTMWGLDGRLPPGVQGNPTECVLAHALGGSFGGDWALPEDRLARKLGFPTIPLPADVRDFIKRFDGGEYPDLIEGAT